jgi:hypothetical protein
MKEGNGDSIMISDSKIQRFDIDNDGSVRFSIIMIGNIGREPLMVKSLYSMKYSVDGSGRVTTSEPMGENEYAVLINREPVDDEMKEEIISSAAVQDAEERAAMEAGEDFLDQHEDEILEDYNDAGDERRDPSGYRGVSYLDEAGKDRGSPYAFKKSAKKKKGERKQQAVGVSAAKKSAKKLDDKSGAAARAPVEAKDKKKKIKEGYRELDGPDILSREIAHKIIRELGQSRARGLYNKIMSGDQSMLDTLVEYILDFSDGKVTDDDIPDFIDSTLDALDALT